MSDNTRPTQQLEATIVQVKKLRVDALYGKKKHFNAADRKHRLRLWLNIPVIVINVLLGSLLFSILQESSPEFFKWAAASLSIIAAILSSTSTFLDLAKQVEGHRRVGNKYISVAKGCDRLIAYCADGLIDSAGLSRRLEELAKSNDEANQEAESFATNDADYQKAQQGMHAGQEDYLPNELER